MIYSVGFPSEVFTNSVKTFTLGRNVNFFLPGYLFYFFYQIE
jgi:hypothetical protein